MATFKSSERIVNADRATIYNRLKNPESFKSLAEGVPDEMKKQVESIRIDGNIITLRANPVGDISFRIDKGVENERLHLVTEKSPFPLSIDVVLTDGDTMGSTKEHVEVGIDLNPILKSMLSKPLQEAAEKFAELIAVIPYN